jgi:HNH endonuclease/Helix-turn-helix domain
MRTNFSLAEAEAHFWAKVNKTDGCWLWTGAKHTDGYGIVIRSRKNWLAHRYAFTLTYGPIPDGLVVCHACDVRPCVRPDHLALGTQIDNMTDMAQKGRARMVREQRGEANKGARLTDDRVREIRALYAQGRTLDDLGRRYSVNPATIWHVVHRRTWRHVV